VSLEPPSAARICVLADPPGLLVQAGHFEGRFPLPGLYAPELADLKARLPDLLHNFRRAVGIQGVALGALAQRALDELDSWAAGLAARLLGGPVTEEFDVDQLETAIAKLLYPALHRGGEVPVIVLETEAGGIGEDATWLLPIEFLRIAEPRRQRPQPNDILRRILGFHAVVVRRGRVPTGPGFLGAGPIPVSALIYETTGDGADLKGPEMQASFFERNRSTFRLRRWPRGANFKPDLLRDISSLPTYNEKDIADGLVQQVFMTAGLDPEHSEPYMGAIVHIACHYHTKQIPQITQPAPFLSFDGRLSTNVGIDALYDAFASRMGAVVDGASIARTAAQRFGQMIVFLNACETATSADHGGSLLDKLFELGFRHIVASETLVPDPLAAAFATQLYLGMMRGLPLGGALLQARTELLERYENPGGLLYTIYGDPWLRFNTKRGDAAA
jgi:CHAT domain